MDPGAARNNESPRKNNQGGDLLKRRVLLGAACAVLIIALAAGCRNTFVSAIIAGDQRAVAAFLSEGANVNEKGADGFTPLHWAAYYGQADMIRYLVSRGAEVNAASPQYGTPLTLAATYGFKDAVKALLEAGADPGARDGAGKTPLDYAKDGGFAEIATLLGGTLPRDSRPDVRTAPQPPPPAPAAAAAPTAGREERPSPAEREAAIDAATPVRIAVYSFHAETIDVSGTSATVTATLIRSLGKTPSLHLVERKELEEFLSLNDLRQNEMLADILQVGERMGIPFIVAGSVSKKGAVYIVQCRLVNVPERKVVLDRQVRSFGEAGLDREVEKLGEAVTRAIRGGR